MKRLVLPSLRVHLEAFRGDCLILALSDLAECKEEPCSLMIEMESGFRFICSSENARYTRALKLEIYIDLAGCWEHEPENLASLAPLRDHDIAGLEVER